MGESEEARKHLEQLAALCGVQCEQYRDLAQAIEQFSRRNPRSYQTILDGIVEQGQRFASDLETGNATSAIASFGRYGHRLAALAAAA